MGGGAGLMFASTYKIATERTKFAMPEIGVGLFPDVGFTSVIKDLPEGLGLYIMLTASPLNASDLRFCNLVNGCLSSAKIEDFLMDVVELSWHDDVNQNLALLDSILDNSSYLKEVESFPSSKIESELDKIQSITNEENLFAVVDNIMSYTEDDEWFKKGQESLIKGSPTSAHLIWLQHLKSSSLNLKEVFNFELNLAIQITRRGDFKEGIRALIIDKDNKPNWKYDSIKNVKQSWLDKHTDLAWEKNPLEDL
jgi:enoyl-CoA hydratase/carnithine racemase